MLAVTALLACGAGTLPAHASRLDQLRPGEWIVNNDPVEEGVDRSVSFVLSRDRTQLTNVRMDAGTYCFRPPERDHVRVGEKTLFIPTVELKPLAVSIGIGTDA